MEQEMSQEPRSEVSQKSSIEANPKSCNEASLWIKLAVVFEVVILVAIAFIVLINVYVINFAGNRIYAFNDFIDNDTYGITYQQPYDAVIIPRGLTTEGGVSAILYDRLIAGREIYIQGHANKIIVSGNYAETSTMRDFLVNRGVPYEDILLDSRGFNTYYTLYRVRNDFDYDRIIVVTQSHYLHRAVYTGNMLGMETIGVTSDFGTHRGTFGDSVNESMARIRAFFDTEIFRRGSGLH